MHEVYSNRRNWRARRGWVLAALTLNLQSFTALADCQDAETLKKMRSNVVYLEVCAPKCTPGVEAAASATGVLVTGNGLILSVYDLIDHLENKGAKVNLANYDDYQVVASTSKESGKGVATGVGSERKTAAVVGFDQQRGLLLLKISPSHVGTLGLTPPEIWQEPLKEGEKLCSIGYEQSLQSADLPNGSGAIGSLSGRHEYQFDTGFNFEKSQRGSPVYLTNSPETPLVGIASGHPTSGEGKWIDVIPIEYADVLIARVFIGILKAQLASVKSQLTAVKTHVQEIEDNLRAPSIGQGTSGANNCKWSIPEGTKNCPLKVVCAKSLAGAPYIDQGGFRVEADYTDSAGTAGKKAEPWNQDLLSEEAKAIGNQGDSAGATTTLNQSLKSTFCLTGALDSFDAKKSRQGWRTIDSIKVIVSPFARYDGQPGKDLDPIPLAPTPYPGSRN